MRLCSRTPKRSRSRSRTQSTHYSTRASLESALARPRNAAAYESADLVRQAATLFWGIAANHAFRDGNKRLATVLLRAFLNVNGQELSLPEDERFELAIGVAEHHWSVDRVDEILRRALRPSP